MLVGREAGSDPEENLGHSRRELVNSLANMFVQLHRLTSTFINTESAVSWEHAKLFIYSEHVYAMFDNYWIAETSGRQDNSRSMLANTLSRVGLRRS